MVTGRLPAGWAMDLFEVEDLVAIVKGRECLGFARYMFVSDGAWAQAKAMLAKKYGGAGTQ